jgi:branched-chain amino acid transport system substrate-binding protein
MSTRYRRRTVTTAAALSALALALAGCGTQLSRSQVIQAAGGAPATSSNSQDGSSATGGLGAAGNGAVTTPGGTADAAVGAGASGGSATGTAGSSAAATAPVGKSGTSAPVISTPGRTASSACASQGAPLVIGQVGSFSGLVGQVVSSGRTGLAVWAKDVNAHGGIACHPVQIYSEDDASDTAKSSQDVQDLVQNKHAVALVGSFVPISVAGFRSGVESAKVPAVGGDLLGPDWNQSPYMFPQGAGIGGQIYGAYRQAVQNGHTKLAMFYCVEASICTNAYNVTVKQGKAKAAGAQVVYEAQVSLTANDFTAQCQNAKNAGADLLGLAVDGPTMGRIARSCATLGYHPAIATVAVAIGAAQSQDSNLRGNTISIASPVTPWTESSSPAQQAYRAALARYAPSQPADGPSAVAWASGKMLEAALGKVDAEARKGPITTALVLKGLGLIKKETLGGLIGPISYVSGRPTPDNDCTYFVLLKSEGWTAPRGSRVQC